MINIDVRKMKLLNLILLIEVENCIDKISIQTNRLIYSNNLDNK